MARTRLHPSQLDVTGANDGDIATVVAGEGAWAPEIPVSHGIRSTHTFAIAGPVGDGLTPRFRVSLAAGQTAQVVGAYYECSTGTSDVDVDANGGAISGLSALAVSATPSFAAALPALDVSEGDEIGVTISNTNLCEDLAVAIVLEHTITP